MSLKLNKPYKSYFKFTAKKTLTAATFLQVAHLFSSSKDVYIERIIYSYIPDTTNEADGDYIRFHVSQDTETDIKMQGDLGVAFDFQEWLCYTTSGGGYHYTSGVIQFDIPLKLDNINNLYLGLKATRAITIGVSIFGFTLEGGISDF